MIVKSIKPNVGGRPLRLLKVISMVFLCFLILHFSVMNLHPTYHQRIIKNFEPIIAKVNFGVSDLIEANLHPGQKYRFGIEPEYEKYIKELGLVDPGQFGAAVNLPANISDEIKKKIEEGYRRHGYNAFVSNIIRVDRDLVDTRAHECKIKTYDFLPKCTVIIPFHNEEFSLLLRTVYGVLNRSPDELVEEVLLVDDASDREEMLEKLDNHFKLIPKVKILRSPVRQGIMLTRMLGVVNAIGPVLVFLDSHVEVMHKWLEPVLDRFKNEDKVLVTMWHLKLDKNTLMFDANEEKEPIWIGGFFWNLDFAFIGISGYEGDQRTPLYDPKPSPTIFGSMHAIRKDFFISLGMYDKDFDVWGGEDVELAFRVWCCGGKVEYVPCSKASHVSKDHRYTWPASGKGGYRWNTDRIAETWLGEYKKYYYRSVGGSTKDRNYGNVSERVELIKKLNCKPFKWYYENICKNWSISEELRDPTTVSTV